MTEDRVVPRVGRRMLGAVKAALRVAVAPAPRGLELRAAALRIVQRVADRHGLTVADLRGRDRSRHVAWARHEAYDALRGALPLSLPQIGRFFDGRDHTTVADGIRAHRARAARLARHGVAA